MYLIVIIIKLNDKEMSNKKNSLFPDPAFPAVMPVTVAWPVTDIVRKRALSSLL